MTELKEIKTKEMFKDLCNFYKYRKLKNKDCAFNYKQSFKTLKNYKSFLKENYEKYEKLRQFRAETKKEKIERTEEIKGIEKLRKKILKKKKDLFELNLRLIVNTRDIEINNSNTFNVEIEEDLDWNYYSKNYPYPKKWHKTKFYINLKNFDFIYRRYIKIDGIINLEIQKCFKKNNFIFIKALTIQKKKDKGRFVWKTIPNFICLKESFSYHSEKSFAHAQKGVERKLKKIKKEKEFLQKEDFIKKNFINILKENSKTLEKAVTIESFRKKTGACREGILAFCLKKDLNPDNVKIKDLLKYEEERHIHSFLLSETKEIIKKK